MDANQTAVGGRLSQTTTRRLLTLVAGLLLGAPIQTRAADYRTQNFLVTAPDSQLAQQVGEAAERYRDELAEYWIGHRLPPWPRPCPIRVVAGNLPAQGVTQYQQQPVRDFNMEVIGTPRRILDSVLPHEVNHAVLATHFGRPLPRWADEGICTTVEHAEEKAKHEAKLREFLSTRRGIPMNKLFLLKEYPSDMLPMYAQGYSVCRFLIAQSGPQPFIEFLQSYYDTGSWTDNVRRVYGYESLAELQTQWLGWVKSGGGPVDDFVAKPIAGEALVAAGPARQSPAMTLASTAPAADSWYARGGQRNDESGSTSAAKFSDGSDVPVTTIGVPPSVAAGSRYSAAQPQPEFSTATAPSSYRGDFVAPAAGLSGGASQWR